MAPDSSNVCSLQVSVITALDSLEGGMATETGQGLAIMYESDSMIESPESISPTVAAHWCK